MARKLTDIAQKIHHSTDRFSQHLRDHQSEDIMDFLDRLSQSHAVYLFSGIIRDFFLRYREKTRDLDIMVEGDEKMLENLLKSYDYQKNSFDGYKVRVGEGMIDIWHIQKTWALTHGQTVMDFGLHTYIPHTAFFNFSSIIYDYNDKKFHFTIHFLRFLRDRHIDIVYQPNPNIPLCIVNTFYYNSKYKLRIAPRLGRFIRQNYPKYIGKYEAVQEKHFGEVIFGEEEILKLIMGRLD
ncbi:hypothetical protein LJC68_09010 [Bacteroidales bacterium OttesenSCG-928-B11]|nr:hypothetical protein [Bacteroidales bacterium OttesenSCG-928-E04]MDL2309462.1 hypothetical protein [Bacteroidales bacterium OttesenSCG-928-C03]MDL2312999.1 hypothetical protein [Bacteroidales bacterium OttesenSCG-928-B11]